MKRIAAFFRRASRRAYAIGLLAAAAVWLMELLAPRGMARTAIAYAGLTVFGLASVAMLARAFARAPLARRAPWAWLTASALSWTAGQLALDLYDIGWLVPSAPAPSDVLFLAAAPLFVAGCVAFLVGSGEGLAIAALGLDVGAVVLTLFAGVALVVGSLFTRDLPYEPVQTTTALLYPVLYVAATGAALSTLFGLPVGQARGAYASLVAGIGLNGLAFTLWLPRLVSGSFDSGSLLDPMWMVGVLAIGVAGLQWVEERVTNASTELAPQAIVVSRLLLPAATSVLAAAILIASRFDRPGVTDPLIAISIAGTMILLASRAGLALYANVRLTELQRRRAVRYQALYEAGLDIAEEHSLEELLKLVVDKAVVLTGCDGASLSLRAGDGYLVRSVHLARDGQVTGIGESPGGIAREAIDRRDLVVVPDYGQHPRHNPQQEGFVASAMAAPFIARGAVIGSLVVYSPSPRRFAPELQRLFRLFVAQAAIAISNATLLDETVHLALDDPLTGVRNRRSLVERLEIEVAAARRHGDAFCVVMCDLDGLKQVNDTAGHLVGDQVLKDVAAGLRASARVEDVVARFGGDEFVLLLPRTTLLQGQALVARVGSRLRDRTYQWGGRQLPLPRVSIGIAAFPDDGLTADALIAAADARMYAEKAHGRAVRIAAAEA